MNGIFKLEVGLVQQLKRDKKEYKLFSLTLKVV